MPRYKFIALWVFLVLSPTVAAAQVASSGQVPISLTINAPSSDAKAGSELKVSIVLTNTSDEPVGLTTWPEDFRMDVLNSKGKVVGKPQKLGESRTNAKPANFPAQGSSQGITIAPHGVFRLQENLSEEFDLSKPGKYTVQATRMYSKTPVKSNMITITVVP